MPRISSADLLADLARVANDLGDPPTMDEYAEHGEYAEKTIRERFDGWNNALDIAGIVERPPEAHGNVDLDDIIDAYYRRALPIRMVADELDVSRGQINNRLEAADIPMGLPSNVRFLLYNPPTPFDELPSEPGQVDRQLGVTTFRIAGDGPAIAYFHGEHAPAAVLRNYFEAYPDVLDGLTYHGAILRIGRHGTAFKEAAEAVLPDYGLTPG